MHWHSDCRQRRIGVSGPRVPASARSDRLTVSPAVAQSFELESVDGEPICTAGTSATPASLRWSRRGASEFGSRPNLNAVAIRVGVIGGMATAMLAFTKCARPRSKSGATSTHSCCRTDRASCACSARHPVRSRGSESAIGRSAAATLMRASARRQANRGLDRLMPFSPLLMWIAAAFIAWLVVGRLLMRPLKRLERAVVAYRPGEGTLELPERLGPRQEIRELRNAFARAIARVEDFRTRDDLRAGRPAAAGPRSPPPGEKQPPGCRLTAQHPRAERRNARSARRLCRDQPPGRRALDSSSQPFRRDGGKSRDRASAAGDRARRRASRRRAGSGPGPRHRPRYRHALHNPGRRRRGLLPDHRDCRVRDAPCPARRWRSRSGGRAS